MEGLAQLGTGLEHLHGGGESRAMGPLDLAALVWALPHCSSTLLASSRRLLMGKA